MEREKIIKLLNDRKASRDELRRAIAFLLGMPYQTASKQDGKTLFKQCSETFGQVYKEHTGVDYFFAQRDGIALSEILKKIGAMTDTGSDDEVATTFSALLLNLPEWYKKNAFSLRVINSKFNEIVASIRNEGKKGVTDSFKRQTISDLFT